MRLKRHLDVDGHRLLCSVCEVRSVGCWVERDPVSCCINGRDCCPRLGKSCVSTVIIRVDLEDESTAVSGCIVDFGLNRRICELHIACCVGMVDELCDWT